ncbi:MAG: protein TonB [Kiritimatiellia bacterium]|jgi:protein TonB
MNPQLLEEPRWRWAPLFALAGALVLAALLFLMIPLSRMGDRPPLPELTTRTIRTVRAIPPKAPPPPPVPEDADKRAPPPPRSPNTVAELTLAQLDIALAPGTGDALAMGLNMDGFALHTDLVDDIEKIFDFSELPEVPGLVFIPDIQFPRDLTRRGVKNGKVVLLVVIDETGKPQVEAIRSSTHPSLEAVARRFAERARFSVSKVKGEAVKVRGEWPLILQAPQ